MSRAGTPALVGPGSLAATGLLATLASTWRVERAPGFDARDRELRGGRRCILVFWHCRLLPLAWTHRGRRIVVLVSRHGDGEWVARVLERMGSLTARGSSTRGGEVGLKELFRHAARGHTIAITPDGPRGPAERVKAGAIVLAARTGLPVVPLTAIADRSWVLRSWDRFRIPRPFARVRLAYGEPITVPRDLDADGIEAWRRRVEAGMDALERSTAAAVGERPAPDRAAPAHDAAAGGIDAARPARPGDAA